jgi:hypothetical protein
VRWPRRRQGRPSPPRRSGSASSRPRRRSERCRLPQRRSASLCRGIQRKLSAPELPADG